MYQIGLVSKTYPQIGIRLLQFLLDLVIERYEIKFHDWQLEGGEPGTNTLQTPTIYWELHSIDNHNLEEAFHVVSQAESQNYLKTFLPWLDDVLSRREVSEEAPSHHYIWDELSANIYNVHEGVDRAFIFGLIDALVITADSNQSLFENIVAHLSQSPFRTPQLILVHSFKALAGLHASKALQFILADRRRLEIGDVDAYDSRQLVQAIYPYLNDKERSQLEEFILQPPLIRKNLGLDALRWRGLAQFHLLQSIPIEYLSEKALCRLREWGHKFPDSTPFNDPVTMRGGTVQSPIPIEVARRMSDQQWLKAMNKYHGAIEHREFLKGERKSFLECSKL